MADVKQILYQLALPFNPERVHFRVGSTNKEKTKGLALAYVDARDVMDRLDEVVGAENWSDAYPYANGKTCCVISLYINGQWVSKSDGAGDTDYEGAKGAFSDSFKRAAVKWGIARYLYGLGNSWVEIEQRGKSYVIKPEMFQGLRAKLPQPPGTRDQVFGPLSKSDLTAKLREFAGKLGGIEDPDSLTLLLNQYTAELEQCERDMPAWWFGQPNSDNEGLNERIQNKMEELASREAAQ